MSEWLEHIPLAPRTTLEVGGKARFFCAAHTVDALSDALRRASEERVPVTILGGGSNMLIADRGIDGLVLHPTESSVEVHGPTVRATAGVEWDALVRRCVQEDLAGLECLSGIPGQVGASPIQNIGAYGAEVAECIESVEVLDRKTLERRSLTNEECQFSYRNSRFKTQWREQFVVTAVTFGLTPGGRPTLRYEELAARFSTDAPRLTEVREAVLAIRRSKSMVWDRTDPNHRSAGSFFMNPIVSANDVRNIEQRSAQNPPRYPAGPGRFKVPAAWLIEHAGFSKGYSRGAAHISTAHALALVNSG
ncbi:MAG: UDP-N-acetylmuramate dehydrogenase, partial [Myxococcota bacterium]